MRGYHPALSQDTQAQLSRMEAVCHMIEINKIIYPAAKGTTHLGSLHYDPVSVEFPILMG
jgi:hypothetical protein